MTVKIRQVWTVAGPLGALVLAVAVTPRVLAQQAAEVALILEEVVVTAQKREESLQDVPLSVEAISGDKLADAGILRMDDLKSYVPNLQMTETGIANNIYIRGIGSGLNQGFEQSVSLYADGIYRGRGHQARMPFLDLARIEVLRGPQPILFGKNAVAGAVNLVSARPTRESEGSVRGWYDTELKERVGDVMLSGPMTDSLGARMAVRFRKTEGYVDNLTLDRSEPRRDELGGRLTFTWSNSAAFDATLRLEGGNFENTGRHLEIFGETPTTSPNFGGQTYGQIVGGGPLPLIGMPAGLPQGTHATSRNNVVDFQRSSNGDSSRLKTGEYALTMNWNLGNGSTITSVTGYSAYSLKELCDCDFVGATVFNAGVDEDYEQSSQELRFTSAPDRKVSWIGGVFYQEYKLDESDYLYVPTNSLVMPVLALNPAVGMNAAVFSNAANPRVFTQDSEQWSVFAQATVKVNDVFRVTAGGRYSNEDKAGSRVTSLTSGLGGPALNVRCWASCRTISAASVPRATSRRW
jgi:iron complex outermembrane recepter protein